MTPSSSFTCTIRILSITPHGSATNVVGYRAVRDGFANGKPLFRDERISVVGFDTTAEQLLTRNKGDRIEASVEPRTKRDGTRYLRLARFTVKTVAPVTETEIAPEPVQEVPLEALEFDRLLELVAELDAPAASVLRIMQSMDFTRARSRAIARLAQEQPQEASFVG